MSVAEGNSSSELQLLQKIIQPYGSMITIDRYEGTPPNYFEITYRIPGWVPGKGDQPEIAKMHCVSIELPFGYPVTIPLVKPLTPIFHPEVSKSSFGIAMRWHDLGSLPELVLCVGRMICGESYNILSLLNPVAADWYQENIDRAKLATLSPSSQISSEISSVIDDIVPEQGISFQAQPGANEKEKEVNEEPQAPGPVSDEPAEPEGESLQDLFMAQPAEDESHTDENPDDSQALFARDEITTNLDKKKVFIANRLLANLGDKLPEEERNELEGRIGAEIVKANVLHEEILGYEDQGDHAEALSFISRLEQVASDYPGLGNLRNRIAQSKQLSSTFSLEEKEEVEESSVELIEKIPVEEQEKTNGTPEPKKSAPSMSWNFSFPDLPYFKVIGTIGCVLLVGVSSYFYFHDKNSLDESRRNWHLAKNLIQIQDFKEALGTAEEAKTNLDEIYILTSKKDDLIIEIDNVLVSKDFVEGLHGKALYEGEYVEFDEIVKLRKLKDLTARAEAFSEQDKFEEAIEGYEEARLFATTQGLESYSTDLQQKISNLRLGEALVEARSAYGEKKWGDAAAIYKKALDVANSVSGVGSEQEERVINQYLTVALFRYQLEQSKQIFEEENWREAVTILTEAENIVREYPEMISPEEKNEFESLFVCSRFYLMLYEARQAYEQENWDVAINNYSKALELLEAEKQLFPKDILTSKNKVAKTLVMTKVAKELSLAATSENQDDLSGAITHYTRALDILTSDTVGMGKGFKGVIATTRQQIEATENRMLVQRKIDWLKDNYIKIFKKYYPSVNEASLLYPEVTLLKKEHDKMVFHLSCVEKTQGRSSRLVLDYVNILGTNKWNLYAGTIKR